MKEVKFPHLVIFVWTISWSLSFITTAQSVFKDLDIQFAERKLLYPQQTLYKVLRKTAPKLPILYEKHFCDLQGDEALAVCENVVLLLNRQISPISQYKMVLNKMVEYCEMYNVKLHWERQTGRAQVVARKCPTTPIVWISAGAEKDEIFIFVQDLSENDTTVIRLEDYAFFTD